MGDGKRVVEVLADIRLYVANILVHELLHSYFGKKLLLPLTHQIRVILIVYQLKVHVL